MLDQAAALFDGQRNWVCPPPYSLRRRTTSLVELCCFCCCSPAGPLLKGNEVLMCSPRLRKFWMRPQ